MAKKVMQGINLIPKRDADPVPVARLKKILPLAAVISLLLFVILFFSSLLYTNSNLSKFNRLKKDVENLENQISSQKSTEGVYTLTASLLQTLVQTISGTKHFSPLISELSTLETNGIRITSALADKKGNISISLTASSSATLSSFVNSLIAQESDKKLFTDMYAAGTIRDRKGKYNLTISMKANPSLFQ